MIDFAHVEKSVKELKAQLAHHQIDEKAFEDQLLALIDIAEDGHYWMFGHESERWFRHNGETWLPNDPPRIATGRIKKSANPVPANPISVEPLHWGWLIISLILLTLIGGMVYNSTVF